MATAKFVGNIQRICIILGRCVIDAIVNGEGDMKNIGDGKKMKINLNDEVIFSMWKRKCQLLEELFKENSLVIPNSVFRAVIEIREIERVMNSLDIEVTNEGKVVRKKKNASGT